LGAQQSCRPNRWRNTYPAKEIVQQAPILIEADREGVGQTILVTIVWSKMLRIIAAKTAAWVFNIRWSSLPLSTVSPEPDALVSTQRVSSDEQG
jgi:hypothetical protein